jgi:hypothetical protein
MSFKEKINKKYCLKKLNSITNELIINNINDIPLLIEGTLRHQSNIKNAHLKYGNTFNGKIILTNYFNNDNYIPTLVCSENTDLILGKPRYPEKFTENEYKITLVDKNNCGLFSIEISIIDLKKN